MCVDDYGNAVQDEVEQLRARVADLEAQLARAQAWVPVADELHNRSCGCEECTSNDPACWH